MWERRSGFDRRRPARVLGTLRDKPQVLAMVLFATFALSIMDGLLTAVELNAGLASEANPVLATLVHIDPISAVTFKVAVTLLVVSGVWNWRGYRSVLAVGLAAFSAYGFVVVYHLGALSVFGVL